MTSETPALRSIPATRISQQALCATAPGVIRNAMERSGALLLGAQALLREMKSGDDIENDREIVALLLDMAIEESNDVGSAVSELEAQS